MRTAVRSLPPSLRRARHELASLGVVALSLAAVEALGSLASTDTEDAPLVVLLVGIAMVVHLWHRRRGLAWVAKLVEGAGAALRAMRGWRPELGIDLRGEPPLPRRTPPAARITSLVAIAAVAAAIATRAHFPDGLRAVAEVAYLPYLALLTVLWSAFLLGSLGAAGLVAAWVHDRFVASHDFIGPRRVGPEAATVVGLFALVVTLAVAAPVWVPFALMGLVVAVTQVAISVAPPELRMSWRTPSGELSATPVGALARASQLGALAVFVVPALLANGDRLAVAAPDAGSTMWLTRLMGSGFAWAGALGLCVVCSPAWQSLVLRRRMRDAALRRPTVVLVGDHEGRAEEPGESERERVQDALVQEGWLVVDPDAPATQGALVVRLDPRAPDADEFFAPLWPERVTAEWLLTPTGRARLARRRVQTLRRQLLRGLSRLFKVAAGRKFDEGGGFWVAPQHWFVEGLARDGTESEIESADDYAFEDWIGPLYAQVMSWEARACFAEVTRDLVIDMIFVEDGVGLRRFARVLRQMFELHDLFGAEQRAEERHFRGIDGVRVVVGEVELGESVDLSRGTHSFAEPDYEEVGRARVLHVFRERGGERTEALVPSDTTGRPHGAPTLV